MNIEIEIGKNLLEAFKVGLDWWTLLFFMLSVVGHKVVKEINTVYGKNEGK